MKVLFCKSNIIGSIIIRSVTWSKWSHVALIDDSDLQNVKVIEAVYPKVRVVSMDEVVKKHSSCVIVDFPVYSKPILDYAYSQVGKPYDVTALLGLLVHRDWQEDDSWFCSELVSTSFDKAGYPLFRQESVNRVTPQHLWMIALDKYDINFIK